MTPSTRPDRRPSAARRPRHAVFALFAAALVVFALTITFGLRTETPTAPLPDPATIAAAVQQRAAASGPPSTADVAAPAPTAAVVPAAPEAPPPTTIQGSAPAASAPDEPVLGPRAPAEPESVAPGATTAPDPVPAPGEPAPPADDAAAETWMRHQFSQFLDQAGPPVATLSERQRDALFAEFLAWRRARGSADHAQPAQPGP